MPEIRSDYLHIIITKYNIGLYNLQINHDDWMAHRLSLFDHYCLPSVVGQTCQHFLWVIFLDQKTPSKWLDRILPSISDPNILPILLCCGELTFFQLNQAVTKHVLGLAPPTTRFLVTNTLDNDDFLGTNFVRRIHEVLRMDRKVPYVIDSELIYIIKEQELKLEIADCSTRYKQSKWMSPLFIAIEERQLALTCLHMGHSRIRQFIPECVIVRGCNAGRVVHTGNQSLRGDGSDGTYCAKVTRSEPFTKDIIANLVGTFGINPARIWRQ